MNLAETEINFKSEAWKYTPKKSFQLDEFKTQNFDQNTYAWGMGPSEEQFQTMSFEDLLTEDSISLHKPFSLPESNIIDRAQLDKTLNNMVLDKEEVGILLNKSLPTTAWVNANSSPSLFSITLAQKTQQSFCFLESSQQSGLSQRLNFYLHEGSELDLGLHLGAETKSFRQLNFILEENSKLNLFSLMAGLSTYKRLEVRIYLKGEETRVSLNGLSLTKNQSVFDFHSDVFHLNENQETTQIYKSLNHEKGHSIFSGRVHLTEDSSGAQVEQLNNNLLLNKSSKVDTQPELNIYQDDVKASHGATTGSLDEDHFFYFRSRGFKLEQAKKMLLEGFCLEPLNHLQNPGLKEYFKNRIMEEL